MKLFHLAMLALTGALWAGAAGAQALAGSDRPIADHHIHIFSPRAADALKAICVSKAKGPNPCPAEISMDSSTAEDVIAALDQAGIQKGTLLSAGYFFGSPVLGRIGYDVTGGTHEENAFIVAQAASRCDRLTPFVSVNPLLPDAVKEVAYWGRHGGAAGLKLHLGNSAFDFRSPDQVKKLAAVFATAGRYHMAIVIHMQTQIDTYGAGDVRIFLRDVYPKARGATIQIAHAASGGGANKQELEALGVFAEAMAKDPKGMKNVYFDLAMVPDLFANAGKIPAAPADVAALRVLMRQIGLNRFLLASDYTRGLNLSAYFANQKAALGLSDDEWRTLAANPAPYIADFAKRRSCAVKASR
jgi:predicted TIM-barrel fold metal-dependent hydrolase